MHQRFDTNVAIVTGGGSGIGAATAERLAAEGAAVLVVDRNLDGAEHTAARIRAAGGNAEALSVDVGVERDVAAMVAHTQRRWSRIDVLVNNAGIGSAPDLAGITTEEFMRVMSTNLLGPLLCCKHVVPLMGAQQRGAIINVASISATCGMPDQPIYAPSKGGLLQMTRQLAVDVATRGIRVNCVSPGTIDTPMIHSPHDADASRAEINAWLLARHPLGRFGRAAEVAAAIAFLASDEASFITGANLAVDGGYTAQ